MRSKLSAEAFIYYCGLGPSRSHDKVAERFGVSRATVSRTAKKEKWAEQIADTEARARETAKQKLQVSLEEVTERHLRVARLMLSRGVEALRSMPLSNPRDAVKAIDIAMKHERELVGMDPEEAVVEIL